MPLIETPDANQAKGMRQLNGVYTQRFNAVHGRCGHVFQGRYKAIIVQKETYLKELARYSVLNPVRAGMVSHAADWPWLYPKRDAAMSARQRPTKKLMIRAFTKSMKKPQTKGTMMKARCAGPYCLATADMLTIAVAVEPSVMPPKPALMTLAS